MRGPRRRLPSSDDGLFLPRRSFGGLKKTYGNLAISAQSMSEPRIDDECQYPVSEHFKRGRWDREQRRTDRKGLDEWRRAASRRRAREGNVVRLWLCANEVHAL